MFSSGGGESLAKLKEVPLLGELWHSPDLDLLFNLISQRFVPKVPLAQVALFTNAQYLEISLKVQCS